MQMKGRLGDCLSAPGKEPMRLTGDKACYSCSVTLPECSSVRCCPMGTQVSRFWVPWKGCRGGAGDISSGEH